MKKKKKKKIKSVRFHENVEIEGVSQVLKDLQRKHNVEKSKKRKLQSPPSKLDSDTILGVLNDLQKRHGASTSKKKRRSKSIDRSSLEGMESTFEEVSSGVELCTYDRLGHSHPQEQSPQHLKTHTPCIEPGRTLNHRPDLFFTGVVVLVNGHTSPDTTTIMRLLHKYGGDLEKYETTRVTHIIAEQLSSAKANIYKSQQKPTPVCRPDWITESVECGKLLPFADYLLDNVRNANALSVKSFFGTKTPPSDAHELIDNTLSSTKNDMNVGSTNERKSKNRWQDTHPSETNYHLNGQVRTVGNDPNFLESYFSSSRLSYIGSFKQRVKHAKQTASSSKLSAGSTRFVLLVDMDCFFASVALRKYPQYIDKPVAVGHTHVDRPNTTLNTSRMKNSSSELSTCNYIARKCGIRKGMFLGTSMNMLMY
jgi:DNA repair protein REV1